MARSSKPWFNRERGVLDGLVERSPNRSEAEWASLLSLGLTKFSTGHPRSSRGDSS